MMSLQISACCGGCIALVHLRVIGWLVSKQDWVEFILCAFLCLIASA